jgi:hypothetical protein
VSSQSQTSLLTDVEGTTFVRLGGALVRIDVSGVVTSHAFAWDGDFLTSGLVLTADGDVLVTSERPDEMTGVPAYTLHFLAADTLEERRAVTLPFEVCGPPALGPNGTMYVPACDGTMRVLGAHAP